MQARSATARVTLRDLVDPGSRIEVQGRLIQFALLGQIRFDTLDDLFAYIDGQAGRWRFDSAAARQAFADGLMRRGVESRVVSMETELPLELVLTHTRADIERAVTSEKRRDAPLGVQGPTLATDDRGLPRRVPARQGSLVP